MPSYFDDRGRGPIPTFSFRRPRRRARRLLFGSALVLLALVAGRLVLGNQSAERAGDREPALSAGSKTGSTGASPGRGSNLPVPLRKLLGHPVSCGGGTRPLVALTFDDGPGPFTSETMRLLREHGAGATFFLAGTLVRPYTDLVRRQADAFEVGNHGWSHVGLAGRPNRVLRREIARPERLLRQITGTPVFFFRPPWGARDRRLDRYVASREMVQVLWSLDSRDAQIGVNADDIVAAVRQNVTPGDIVLLHENRVATQRALPDILEILEDRGLQAVPLTDLLLQDPPSRRQLKSGTCP